MSKIKVWEGYWTVQDVRNHPNWLFIFGDNLEQRGKGGQAVIRDEPNSFGLPTKNYPSMNKDAFLSDDPESMYYICSKMIDIEEKIQEPYFDKIVLSANGYGNGLAKLPEKAPSIYTWICDWVEEMIKEYGDEQDINKLNF